MSQQKEGWSGSADCQGLDSVVVTRLIWSSCNGWGWGLWAAAESAVEAPATAVPTAMRAVLLRSPRRFHCLDRIGPPKSIHKNDNG